MRLTRRDFIRGISGAALLTSRGRLAHAATTGGTVIFGRSADGDGLDPATNTNGYSQEVEYHIMDTLVQFKPLSPEALAAGKGRLGVVEPALAESWKVSEDGLAWTFTLRQGVTFHDGSPLNADAIILNIDRTLNESNPHYFKGRMLNGQFLFGSVESYRAADQRTVEIKLKRRYAPFLKNLSTNYASIVSPTALKRHGQDFARNPVGTGAFKFVEWVRDDHITVERNPNWWGGKTNLDKVIFRTVKENSVRLAKLQAGEVDFIEGINPDDVPRIQGDPNLTLYQVPGGINAIFLQCTKKPYSDVRVRQALNYAVNREEITRSLYNGLAVVANSPIPPSIPEYDPSLKAYPHDPRRAKELLAAAGYPNGFEARMITYNTSLGYNPAGGGRLAEVIQQYLAEVNVKVRIELLEQGAWLPKRRAGDFDMAVAGWMGTNLDADGFFSPLYYSGNIGSSNHARISDSKLDELIIKGQQQYDAKERVPTYKELQEYLMQIVPWIYINVPNLFMAGKKRVRDVELNSIYVRGMHRAWVAA